MTRNNKVNIALSLLIAICGWIYVMYNVDPTTTRTFKDVPVTFTHEDVLTSQGIALKSTNNSKITVTVEGKRSSINKMSADDVQAIADLSEAGKGENTIDLSIKIPSKISVVSESESSITVNVESLDTKEVPARVEYKTESSSDSEPILDGNSKEMFIVSGAKSLVSKVKYVRIPVEEAKLSTTSKTFNVSLEAVDNKGDVLSHVTVRPAKTSVTVSKGVTKEVTLKVKVKNPDDENYKRIYQVPDTVTIKGTQSAVDEVESITTEEIDLSEVTSAGTIPIECILPDGVQLANDSLDLKLTVNVTKKSE
jgi:YbbR domain-containing protein